MPSRFHLMGYFFLLLLFTGCISDQDTPVASTRYNLMALGRIIRGCQESGVEVAEHQSLSTLLLVAADRDILLKKDYESKYYEVDHWNRPFRWECRRDDKETVIRVTSDGMDGVPQGGENDDLYVEVRFSPSKKAEIFLKSYGIVGSR